MKQKRTYFLLFMLIGLVTTIFVNGVQAAPPANDNFANAQLLNGQSGQISVTNVDATKETDEPNHAKELGGKSVWYKYVASGNGVLNLHTNGDFGTLLAVYRGNFLFNMTEIASNNNIETENHFSVFSEVNFGTQSGATYYIVVDGEGGQSGTTDLYYEFTNAAWNDNFAVSPTIGLSSASSLNSITTSNVGAGKQVNEPNIAGNQGGKSVWFRINNQRDYARSFDLELIAKGVTNPTSTVVPLFAIYRGNSLDSLTEVTHLVGSNDVNRLTLLAEPETIYYIAIDTWDSGSGSPTANFTLNYRAHQSLKVPDFDRDGKTDLSIYRPSTGTFYSRDTITGNMRVFQWGLNGDKPMFNDFDYDGKPDYSVYRPDTQVWYAHRGSTNTFAAYQWGIATDIPMTLTRFSNGNVSPYSAVFRPNDGTWWIRSENGTPTVFSFGQNGDIPMTADFDGDGTDEVVVFRPSNGTWYLADAFTGEFKGAYQFGLANDVPVPADYDGDGLADIAVYRNGTWWIRRSSLNDQVAYHFGIISDKPQPADYDGDGLADLAVYRNGVWWILRSSNLAVRTIQFGLSNDIPLSSPFGKIN